MSNRQLIIIALVAIGILYLMFFVYLIVRATKNNVQVAPIYIGAGAQNEKKENQKNSFTEFFNQSALFALKIISGSANTDQYSGQILSKINELNKLNSDERNMLKLYVDQILSDKENVTESELRRQAENNNVPLWFEILSFSCKKTFGQAMPLTKTEGGTKIISINAAS